MPLHVYQLSKTNPIDASYLYPISRIHLAAWLTVPITRAVYYGPQSAHPEYLKFMHERHLKAFQEEDECLFAVILDDELEQDEEVTHAWEAAKDKDRSSTLPKGKVIAGVRYDLVPARPSEPTTTDLTKASNAVPPTVSSTGARGWAPQCHAALASDYWSHLVKGRIFLTEELGAHLLVDTLFTDPAHHKRGAGSMLMRHCCSEADNRGLPSMLEASPKGLGVYESVGYRKFGQGAMDGQGNVWVDLDRWADGEDKGEVVTKEKVARTGGLGKGEGWYAQVLMVRPKMGS